MDFLRKPPSWLADRLPDGVRSFLDGGGWYLVLGAVALLILLLAWGVVSRLGRSRSRREPDEGEDDLRVDLASIPAAPPLTGDRRLTVEGVPVRLRLVVVAPSGRGHEIEPSGVRSILDRVVTGLGKIADDDRPEVRVWPFQLSHDGFANSFHNNITIPEGEHAPSRWVLAAGRAQLETNQIMLGLVLQAGKPTTLGRLRLEKHEWANVLRIRTRD